MISNNYRLATQIFLDSLSEDSFEYYLDKLTESGSDLVQISLCEFFSVGEKRKETLEKLKKFIGKFREHGIDPVVWTSSLGYGGERDPEFGDRFSDSVQLESFDGRTAYAVCPTDEKFSDAMAENVKDFIRCGAKTILWDDDMVISVRPGVFCVCENHRKMLKEKLGKELSAEEIKNLFYGKSSYEREAFLSVVGESLYSFARKMRLAADSIDPSVHMGICASYTHFDVDCIDMGKLCRILAGKDSVPYLRLSGAPYWYFIAKRFPGESLGDICEFVRMQAGWYCGKNMIVLDENDSYPRNVDTVPAYSCELYDKVTMTVPGLIRNKYFLCYNMEEPREEYYDAHIANMKRDSVLESVFKNAEPYGIRVYEAEHKIKDAEFTDNKFVNGKVMCDYSQPYAGIFLTENCIPTMYNGLASGIVFGENARHLSEEEIKSGLIIDSMAKEILTERGVTFICQRKINTLNNVFDCYVCEETDGTKFAVLDYDFYKVFALLSPEEINKLYSPEMQSDIMTLWNYVSDNSFLPYLKYNDNSYIVTSLNRQNSKLSVLVLNYSDKDITEAELCNVIAEKVEQHDGNWIIRENHAVCSCIPYHDFSGAEIEINYGERRNSDVN